MGTGTLTIAGTTDEQQFTRTELLDRFPTHEESFRIVCSSSGATEGRWRCIRMRDVLLATTIPETATHLIVQGADGYQAPVEVAVAYGGALGLERLDQSSPGDTPRLLSSKLPSERTVSSITHIDWLAADPDTHPEQYASW